MENPLKGKYDIGVVIGRFQVPYLTSGHKHVIDNVADAHKQLLIVVGVSPTLGTKKNPLSYTARMEMLQSTYPKAIITHLMDVGSDEIWSKNLDILIRSICPLGSVCLYGGRDSFIKSYKGAYPTFEIGVTDKTQGVEIREEIGKQTINSNDFRAGIIYHSQNQYPKVYPCVDIAILKKESKQWRVLMGKRKGNDKWRFPGGFVDPSDLSFEDAARRELIEEMDLEADELEYVCSNRQQDWRYNGPEECITTVLYKAQYIHGNSKLSDEFEESEWILLSGWAFGSIEPTHLDLFEKLLNNMKIKYDKKEKEEALIEEEEDEFAK